MTRDPELFPNPEDFIPERYLEEVDETTAKKRDPRSYIFGFGRRFVAAPIAPNPYLETPLTHV